jgi:hypothetical protein
MNARFKEPKTMFEVKHFLGLVNYFCDHVPNFSVLAIPLQKIVIGYTKSMRNRKVMLEGADLAALIHLRDLIDRSQKLFYFDIEEGDQIHLKTDASDYGIGAYLYILRKGVEIPIRFLSRSLAKAQLNWSTPEKQCFAIWYASQQLSHLLQDAHFVIHTDHENLTRAYSTGSAKVFRWRMFMQEFSYTKVHIKGEDNVVADSLSRLCHDYLPDDESKQALAHEAESIELIAAFLATQEMVEYVAPTTEWAATEVDMDVDVAQEQLQHIPAGPKKLTAETFELIQRDHKRRLSQWRLIGLANGSISILSDRCQRTTMTTNTPSLLSTRFHDSSS